MRLRNGDRVGIVGGGPAGSFAALHLLALAAEAGLQLEILIFEPHGGAPACKGCAGILSGHAVKALAALGLELPPDLIQSEIEEYAVRIGGEDLRVRRPDPNRRILSVYRGTGPRRHGGPPIAGFDAFLLAQAAERGARIIPERALRVESGPRPTVHTAAQRETVDLVVAAFGVNSHPVLEPAFGYRPPRTEAMEQDELARPAGWPADSVSVFFGRPEGLLFGAMIPKRAYLNVSLLGSRMGGEAVRAFYAAHAEELHPLFGGAPESLCGCRPLIPVSAAPRCHGERWVAVGDAAVSRLYKDGIYSAYCSAGAAMRTAVERGVGAREFESGYEPFCREMQAENRYGRILFRAALLALRQPYLSRCLARRIRMEEFLPYGEKIFSRLLWGMLTGEDSYRGMFRMAIRPASFFALLAARDGTRAHGGTPA